MLPPKGVATTQRGVMPVKFKPSQVLRDRATGKLKTEHYYIKSIPKEELIEYINSSNGRPKIKQKCRNELTRRGVNLVYVDPPQEN